MKKIVIKLNLLTWTYLICFSQINELKYSLVSLKNNDTSKAIVYLKNCASPICYQKLVEIYLKQRRYNEAKMFCRKLFDINDTLYALELSKIYSLENNKDSALFWLAIYLRKKSEKLPENILKGLPEFFNLKKLPEWDLLWKTDWYNEYEKNLGEIYYLLNRKEYLTVIELINKLPVEYKKCEKFIYLKALAFYESGNLNEALDNIGIILNKTKNKDIVELAFKIYFEKKDYKSALNMLKKLLEIEPWNINYIEQIIMCNMEAENYNELLKYSDDYIKYDTLNYKVFYYRGYAYYLKNDFDKAIENYSKSIMINGGAHESYFERGKCYYELKNYEKAYYNFSMAIDVKPFTGKYFFYRALAALKLDKRTSACSDFKKASQYGFVQAEMYLKRYCVSNK
ncbi:MAG: tetratricopeptide repeat protein [Bacteroidales bacterium]|nr:tetratricopeptide repeat protein [Bacteroidales bacterium]